jgi:hypothetical protein
MIISDPDREAAKDIASMFAELANAALPGT